MFSPNVEEILRSADGLNADEMLETAQRLIERARGKATVSAVDVNALAGTLTLEEEPLAIQERMRREWE